MYINTNAQFVALIWHLTQSYCIWYQLKLLVEWKIMTYDNNGNNGNPILLEVTCLETVHVYRIAMRLHYLNTKLMLHVLEKYETYEKGVR